MEFDDEIMDGYETLMLTDENGEEGEFVIIDSLEKDGIGYILVIEAELIDDDDADAMILKKVKEEGEEVSYELIIDDNEFDLIADLFSENSEDYDVQIDE